jgi:glycosyltransferase involved in cell wall biosynthesis
MKIAMLLSGAGLNGVTVHCRLLTRYLLSKQHEILLVHRESSWIPAQIEFQRTSRFISSFTLHPNEILAVGEQILRFDTDVIHTHMSAAHAYGAIYRVCGNIPVVASAHAMHFQLHWPFNDQIIATSFESENFYRKYNFVSRDRIATIPNFVDTHYFRPPNENERLNARLQFGLSEDSFVVGFVGDLIQRKRPQDVVLAFAEVCRTRPNACLLLVGGSGPKVQKIRSFAERLGVLERLITPGALTNVRPALWAMDVFAHASGEETGPVALLEAAATALAVVGTDVGMVSEFISDGKSGFVIPVGSPKSLADKIETFASDRVLRTEFGKAARRKIVRKFSASIVAPQIEAALLKTCQRYRRARSIPRRTEYQVDNCHTPILEEQVAHPESAS